MKNLTKTTFFLLLTLMLPTLAICQDSSETIPAKDALPYKTMNLRFVLEGSPTPEDVGFNNPKSFWQFRYELRFLPYELRFLRENTKFQHFTEKVGESQKERTMRIRKNNKADDKAWKKYSILVAKGKVVRSPLLSDAGREIIIPVSLTPEITDVLAKAENTWQNPSFRIRLTGKVSTQTNSNLKFKQKIPRTAFICPAKIITKDAQYWSANTCGISIEVSKKEDGRIVARHFWRI